VHSTLVGQQQNDEMRSLTETSVAQNEEVKKISAWAAIGFAPTIVGTIYGMNFDHMPELHWHYGYPLALALMVAGSTALYILFKRRKWLYMSSMADRNRGQTGVPWVLRCSERLH
jgi:magnesium transporter